MAVDDAFMFPGFLTPVLKQLSFQSLRLLFSHALTEVRGESTPKRKGRLNRVSKSQPPGHESDTLTTEPPGWGNWILCIHDYLMACMLKCNSQKF